MRIEQVTENQWQTAGFYTARPAVTKPFLPHGPVSETTFCEKNADREGGGQVVALHGN